MYTSKSFVFISLFHLFMIIPIVSSASVQYSKSNKLPMYMEYKIHLKSGQSDWYYQDIEPGAILHIELYVIKGNHENAGFAINDTNGKTLVPYEWTKSVTYDTKSANHGYYRFLLDNRYSTFSGVTVAVHISAYSTIYEKDDIILQIEDFGESSQNITAKLKSMEINLKTIHGFLYLTRKLEWFDLALMKENNEMITRWSIIQCLTIIIAGGLHVYFIRQFFKTPSTKKINTGRYPKLILGFR